MNDKYIIISGRITSNLIEVFIRDVLEKVNEGDHLHLCLLSHGGDVPLAFGLASFLKSLPCMLTSYNMSYIDSAAILLFASAQERICTPCGMFRLHPVTAMADGAAHVGRLQQLREMVLNDTARVCRYLEESTGNGYSYWKRLMEEETSLDCKQAVKCNLATALGPLPKLDMRSAFFVH